MLLKNVEKDVVERMLARTVSAVLIGSALIFGCAVPQKSVRVVSIEKPGIWGVTFPTELRGAYFVTRNGTVRYCAEPAPDVALDTLQKLASKVSGNAPAGKGISGEIDAQLSTKIVQLAGRTELILLAREMLYRACELTINYPLDSDTANKALSMYTRVAELVERLARIDLVRAEADLLQARYQPDDNSSCIQNWLEKNHNNVELLNKWLKDNAGGISLALFKFGEAYSNERSMFIGEKNIECS